MDGTRPRLATLIVLGCLMIPGSLASQLVPEGPAVRADTRAGAFPNCPQLAVGPDRSFEIVWDVDVVGSGDLGIVGRHFSSAGEPTGPEQVQITSTGAPPPFQEVTRIAPLPDGFQVFVSHYYFTSPIPPAEIRQRLDGTGSPVGPPELVTVGYPAGPILLGPDGLLYAFYFQAGPKKLFIQPVSSGGTALDKRILLNSRSTDQPDPRIAPLGGGDLVAAWTGLTTGKRQRQVIRARVVQDGVPVGQDFDVNTSPGGTKGSPPYLESFLVVSDPSAHRFAVVWTVRDRLYNRSIHWRLFDSPGIPRTPELIAVPGTPSVLLADAALDDAGNLLLLWTSVAGGTLQARLFALDGAPRGPALQIVANPSRGACGSVAWAGDSWLISYLDTGDSSQGMIVWRRFTE